MITNLLSSIVLTSILILIASRHPFKVLVQALANRFAPFFKLKTMIHPQICNKIVSQFEWRENFGCHLVDHVCSSDEQPIKTLLHPDAQKRRLQLSGNHCSTRLSIKTKPEFLALKALELAKPRKKSPIFHFSLNQNFGECREQVDRCLVLGDCPLGSIFAGWSGHSKTSRAHTVLIRPKAELK